MTQVEVRDGFSDGDIQCLGCGETIHLWFNGGELDWAECCGYEYRTEATGYRLVITEKAPSGEVTNVT